MSLCTKYTLGAGATSRSTRTPSRRWGWPPWFPCRFPGRWSGWYIGNDGEKLTNISDHIKDNHGPEIPYWCPRGTSPYYRPRYRAPVNICRCPGLSEFSWTVGTYFKRFFEVKVTIMSTFHHPPYSIPHIPGHTYKNAGPMPILP